MNNEELIPATGPDAPNGGKEQKRDEFYIRKRNQKIKSICFKCLVYAVLIFLSALVMFPFIVMILDSFRTFDHYSASRIDIWPNPFTWDNYRRVISEVNILRGYLNTLIIIVCELPCNLFFSSMAAFSFAKLRLKNKTFWLLFLLSGMMIPGAVLTMPRYFVYSKIGWIDTFLPLIAPHLFSNAGRMFFFIQFMHGIPSEIFEAAKVDGCSYFKMHVMIMLPLLLPAIAAQAIFGFMGTWNDYFAPSIYLHKEKMYTLQVLLANFFSAYKAEGNFTVVFAGATLSCLPMIVLYLILQKYFIKSMAIGAVKG